MTSSFCYQITGRLLRHLEGCSCRCRGVTRLGCRCNRGIGSNPTLIRGDLVTEGFNSIGICCARQRGFFAICCGNDQSDGCAAHYINNPSLP